MDVALDRPDVGGVELHGPDDDRNGNTEDGFVGAEIGVDGADGVICSDANSCSGSEDVSLTPRSILPGTVLPEAGGS